MNTQPLKDSPTRFEPQSSEAEKAVLGSMLISKEAIPRAMSFLTEESFFDEKNRIIYRNIMQLFENNSAIDAVSLTNSLKKNKELESVGGAYYICLLYTSPSPRDNTTSRMPSSA